VLEALRQRYWGYARRSQLQRWSRTLTQDADTSGSADCTTLLVTEEFFHADLRGFGGFGRAARNVAQHFNTQPHSDLRFAVTLAQATPLVRQVERRAYHDTPVVLRPSQGDALRQLQAQRELLLQLRPRALLSIDWYPSYLNMALALPHTPLLIWIRDPRDEPNWQRISQVPGEMESRGVATAGALLRLADEKRQAMRRLLDASRHRGRKVVFCAKTSWLVPRAAATYGVPGLQAHLLPTPFEAPALDGNAEAQRSARPSLLFLGRLDPVKRPWIAFELAARHPQLDVLVAGQANHPELLAPWLARYAKLPNLKLLGHVDGAEKDRLLRSCWALLNTSVHEAEPVSFMEAFSYGKPVIACHADDEEVRRFGCYAGPLPGDGMDEASRQRLDDAVHALLSEPEQARAKGLAARDFIVREHSHAAFLGALRRICDLEGISL
jgi:glycosyltransferase involved in cell wall biosynthesis